MLGLYPLECFGCLTRLEIIFSLNTTDCVGSCIIRTECLGSLTPVEDFFFRRTLQRTLGVYPLQFLDCLTPLEGNVPLTPPDRVGG